MQEPVLLCMSGKPVVGDPESMGSPASGLGRPGLPGQCPGGNQQGPVPQDGLCGLWPRRAGLRIHRPGVGRGGPGPAGEKPWRTVTA